MTGRIVTVTGGNGFVGRLLRAGLEDRGYRVRVFDRLRGPAVELFRRRYMSNSSSRLGSRTAWGIRQSQRLLELALVRAGVLRTSGDDILDARERLVASFQRSYAVIHLAAIPHPNVRGVTENDARRLNFDGSVNVFEAARAAGVSKFVFASSAQVYGINDPVWLDQLPILESNRGPTLEEGQSMYGHLKREFERYLAAGCLEGQMQASSIRMEYPGIRSVTPANQYISTSVENLIAGFVCALEAPHTFAHESFNLADAVVDASIVDIQRFIRSRWPDVPNRTTGNECLLSTEKARQLLGYRPVEGGTYLNASVVW